MTISANGLRFYARADHWYETTFTLPAGSYPKQLHATIVKESSPEPKHVGKMVAALFKVERNKLTLGVVDSFESAPTEPIVGNWDWVRDVYELERARPPEERPSQ